jgi:hypothetical protein
MGLQFFPGIMEPTHNSSPGALQHFLISSRKTFNFSQEYDRFSAGVNSGKAARRRSPSSFLYLFIGSVSAESGIALCQHVLLALFFTIKQGWRFFVVGDQSPD